MRTAILAAILFCVIASPLGTAHAQGVFVVAPSGSDDTAAIQSAFDLAVDAGPGSTVQLQAGIYCVTYPIVVRGFDGEWTGAGRGRTTVQSCADPFPVPLFIDADPAYPADPKLEIRSAFVFIEVEGKPPTDLWIADMTIDIQGRQIPGSPAPIQTL